MKKIFLLITLVLVISSCGFGKENQEKANSGNTEIVNNSGNIEKSEEQKIVEEFALKIGMKKEDIKKGKYFYPGGKEEEGFQIINPKYPKGKHGELEKLFDGWEMNLPPADGDIETSAWYEKGNIICRLHTKVKEAEEEIKNGDYLKIEDKTVIITCFSKENKKDIPFVFVGKKGKCSDFYKKVGRKDLTEGPCTYEIVKVDLPYFSVSFEVGDTGYGELYKQSSAGYEFVWGGHSVTDEQCRVILKKFPDLKGKEVHTNIYLDCEERFAPLFVAAFPNSYIKIKKDTLMYLDEKNYNNPEKTTNYHLNTIKKDWDIVFEGEYVKGKFERKKCMDDGFGVELPYTVEVTIDGKTYKGCGEEVLDDFFVEGKTGKCSEIAKKTGLDRDNTKADCEYSIGAIYGPYFEVSFNYDVGGYAGVYKKVSNGYETVWEGQDVEIKDCVNVVNNHSRLVYNEKFPLLSGCEERLKNAKGDEVNQIYEYDNFTKTTCNNSALALIREGTEVKTYIEDMEKILGADLEEKNNAENVGGIKESLKNFGLELEKVEKEALFFVLKESHKEEDGTKRNTTTKSFRIKNDTLIPEEYDIVSDNYNELTMTVSGEELEKLKNNYKKDCFVK